MLEGKTIGVFFGGKSPEHDISIITGEFIIAKLKKLGFKVEGIYVDKEGRWYASPEVSELKFFKEDYNSKLSKLEEFGLDLASPKGTLVLNSNKTFGGKSFKIDFAFPAFHGLYGEDGSAQGMFEFFDLPYAGCGIYTSSVAVDKAFTKKFLVANGITTPNFETLEKKNWKKNKTEVLAHVVSKLKFPIFAKPARSGSSIGISKADNQSELEGAIDLAFHYDPKVIVEEGVENLVDVTCALLSDGNELVASAVQQSIFEKGFLSYKDKYLDNGGTQTGAASNKLVIPADISEELKNKIQSISKKIFELISANGTMRVDFLHNKVSGELFVNELNTLPGTLYHHLWEKSGISIDEVLKRMITAGLSRADETASLSSDFESNVLNEANSMKLNQGKS